jgi:thiopurine S-methyltransferase
MDHEFWTQRWQNNQLGWHLPEVHPSLVNFFPRFNLNPDDKVFVPLCGKSQDMVWLADQGMQVIGNELSSIAIQDFFSALQLEPEWAESGKLIRWQAGPYTLYEGNYFDLMPEHVRDVKFVHDRAALIALPKDGEHGRKAYMKQMRKLFSADVQTLLITLDYDQSVMNGPPFSVGYEEVIWHYAFDHIIEFLSDEDILQQEDKFRQRGLQQLTEWTFMMTRYEPVYAAFSDSPQDF